MPSSVDGKPTKCTMQYTRKCTRKSIKIYQKEILQKKLSENEIQQNENPVVNF